MLVLLLLTPPFLPRPKHGQGLRLPVATIETLDAIRPTQAAPRVDPDQQTARPPEAARTGSGREPWRSSPPSRPGPTDRPSRLSALLPTNTSCWRAWPG